MYCDKKMVVFALNAPYYLDSTDISKLTAYYALYSKIPTFIEMAARVLFQELTPGTASPVSIPGAGYDLIDMTAPDPNQIIPLSVEILPASGAPGQLTAASTPVPSFKQGDTIPLQTGVIYDHNGHPVPDDTVVRFIFTIDGGAGGVEQIDAFTGAGRNPHGKANTEYQIETPGLLEIRVESEPAKSSQLLRLNVTSGELAVITAIAPPTLEPTPTPTVTPSPTPTPTPEPTPVPVVVNYPTIADWLLAMLVITMSCVLVYFAGIWWGSMRWGFRWGLCAGLGGLIAYSYLAAGLPGGSVLTESGGTSGIMGFTFLGVVIGIGGGLAWRAWLEQKFLRRP
jgi:beta-N-acetylhexosaminidase